jgi:hypothetical protein
MRRVHPTARDRFALSEAFQCAGSGLYRRKSLEGHDEFKSYYSRPRASSEHRLARPNRQVQAFIGMAPELFGRIHVFPRRWSTAMIARTSKTCGSICGVRATATRSNSAAASFKAAARCPATGSKAPAASFVRNREQFSHPPFSLKIDEPFVHRLTNLITRLAIGGLAQIR